MANVQNEAAYDAAIKRNIIANAQKTWRTSTDRADEIESAIEAGRSYDDYGRVKYIDGFMGSMARAFDTYGKLTPNQSAAVLKGIEARAARKAEWADKEAALNANRKHLGTVGEKTKFELTIKKIIEIQGMSFGRYDNGITLIFIMEDADQNVVVYKGMSSVLTYCDEGDTVSFIATVKEHGVRDGVKQTIVQRPKNI